MLCRVRTRQFLKSVTQNGYTAQCSVGVSTSIIGLAVSPTSKTLNVGETVQLTGTKNPSTASEGTQWISSNTSVATVSNSGLVTAKAAGMATITFKNSASTKSATCSITVEKRYSSSEINSSFYGSLVSNYHGPNDGGMKYRIFYADGTNVYLITDDYVHKNYVPMMDGYTHKYNDYTVEFVRYPTESPFSHEYSYWTQNKNLWKTYYKNDLADYAQGAPSLKIWLASYNQTHKTNITYTRKYDIGNDGNTVTRVIYPNGSTRYDLPMREDFNGIYIKTSRNKADCMIFQDTSDAMAPSIASVGYCNGTGLSQVNLNSGNVEAGFRPVICLNSNVFFRKNTDGSHSVSF